AVVTGSATPMGRPRRRWPGQFPAASSVCAVAPPRTAAWISGMVPRRCGRGSASWADQRPLASVQGTGPRAERNEERITGVGGGAVPGPTGPLIRIGVPGALASRRWAAAGSALAPKPASAVVTATDVRMANSRLAGSRRADPSRRNTNDARAPRILPACGAGAAPPPAPLMVPTVLTVRTGSGRAAGAEPEGYLVVMFSRARRREAGPAPAAARSRTC